MATISGVEGVKRGASPEMPIDMCGRPPGFKGGLKKSWCRVGCDHVSGLAVRCHDRGPRWFPRANPQQPCGIAMRPCIIRGISLVGPTDLHLRLTCPFTL